MMDENPYQSPQSIEPPESNWPLPRWWLLVPISIVNSISAYGIWRKYFVTFNIGTLAHAIIVSGLIIALVWICLPEKEEKDLS